MPINCNDPYLPEIPFDECLPVSTGDEINQIAWTIYGKGFTTAPTATNWNDRVSNTDPLPTAANAPVDDYPIRVWNVKASKPVSKVNEREYWNGRTVRTVEETSVDFEMSDVPLALYEAHRNIQSKGGLMVSASYFTKDREYGKGLGIYATLFTEFILGGNRKDAGKIKGKLTWTSGDPVASIIPPGINFREGVS